QFADELVDGLDFAGFEVSIDRESIIEGEDWRKRLGALIADADTVVFLLSPDAVTSDTCRWEVSEAVRLSKRILPVLVRRLGDLPAPPELAALNYVRFDPDDADRPRSFVHGLRQLARALNTDVDWLREHTRLLARAMEWDAARRAENRMLLGPDIDAAKRWAASRPKDAPAPTELHLDYIKASESAAEALASEERARLQAIETAQAERAEALAAREDAAQKLSRRTALGLATSGGLTVAAAGLAYWGVDAERRVREEQARAARQERERILKEALRTDIQGQLVAYAASPGQFAMDGAADTANSPYTAALVRALADEDATVMAGIRAARDEIYRTVGGRQRPYVTTDLNGEIYLNIQPESRRKTALVVGVDDYRPIVELRNAVNDARAWASFLSERGFDTVALENPTKRDFVRAVEKLTLEMRAADALDPKNLVRPAGLVPIARRPNNNRLFMFFFAGFGLYYGSDQSLVFQSNQLTSSGDEVIGVAGELPDAFVSVASIQEVFRELAAAAIFVMDTDFTGSVKTAGLPSPDAIDLSKSLGEASSGVR
ncbi:MAG: TIR domain-containing protein, partial [Pseudomonadota bacterium]